MPATIAGAGGAGTLHEFRSGQWRHHSIADHDVEPGALIDMQFDEPFVTQQPIGSTASAVTSQVNIYVLNAAGAVVASSVHSNNIATQSPFSRMS